MNQIVLAGEIANLSVIIPVYNSGEEAFRAVQSVAAQTLLPREVILVDDCSPQRDKTKEWLEKIKDTFNTYFNVIILYQRENKGPGNARNAGWNIAKCKYIAFLDSDDIWHPNKIQIQYRFMETHPSIGFSCHHMKVIDSDKAKTFQKETLRDVDNIVYINSKRYLFKHYPIGGTSSVMIKNVSDIRFLSEKRYSEDYLVWMEFCFLYKGALINLYLAAAFKPFYGSGGLSAGLWNLEKGELENYNILRRKGIISFPLSIAAQIFSFLKFIRRIILCMMR